MPTSIGRSQAAHIPADERRAVPVTVTVLRRASQPTTSYSPAGANSVQLAGTTPLPWAEPVLRQLPQQPPCSDALTAFEFARAKDAATRLQLNEMKRALVYCGLNVRAIESQDPAASKLLEVLSTLQAAAKKKAAEGGIYAVPPVQEAVNYVREWRAQSVHIARCVPDPQPILREAYQGLVSSYIKSALASANEADPVNALGNAKAALQNAPTAGLQGPDIALIHELCCRRQLDPATSFPLTHRWAVQLHIERSEELAQLAGRQVPSALYDHAAELCRSIEACGQSAKAESLEMAARYSAKARQARLREGRG